MYTKEHREAIKRAIAESEKNGYTWKLNKLGLLEWSYCNVTFRFTVEENCILILRDTYSDLRVASIWFEKGEKFADCETLTEAYYIATKKAIKNANRLY